MSVSPYGGEAIRFPDSNPKLETFFPTEHAKIHLFGVGQGTITLRGDQGIWPGGDAAGQVPANSYLSGDPESTPPGHFFVLTVVYRHEFSSSLVKILFAGGSNTTVDDIYMLWSRGSGIVDKRDE